MNMPRINRPLVPALLLCLMMTFPSSFFPLNDEAYGNTGSYASPAEVRSALREAGRSLNLQTDFPEELRPERRLKADKTIDPPVDAIVNVARVLLWIAVAVALGSLAYGILNSRFHFSRSRNLQRAEDEPDLSPVATVARMDRAQADADSFADRGDFAEAMHVLLLQSVNEMRIRLDVAIASSLTSREILYHLELPESARDSFADIIRMVEISYFGSHEPGEQDYRNCRQRFDDLRHVLAGENREVA